MANCEKLEACPFFTDKMINMPNSANLMKHTYCFGDKMECARYQVSTAGIAVPPDLFPHDHERGQQILEDRFK